MYINKLFIEYFFGRKLKVNLVYRQQALVNTKYLYLQCFICWLIILNCSKRWALETKNGSQYNFLGNFIAMKVSFLSKYHWCFNNFGLASYLFSCSKHVSSQLKSNCGMYCFCCSIKRKMWLKAPWSLKSLKSTLKHVNAPQDAGI